MNVGTQETQIHNKEGWAPALHVMGSFKTWLLNRRQASSHVRRHLRHRPHKRSGPRASPFEAQPGHHLLEQKTSRSWFPPSLPSAEQLPVVDTPSAGNGGNLVTTVKGKEKKGIKTRKGRRISSNCIEDAHESSKKMRFSHKEIETSLHQRDSADVEIRDEDSKHGLRNVADGSTSMSDCISESKEVCGYLKKSTRVDKHSCEIYRDIVHDRNRKRRKKLNDGGLESESEKPYSKENQKTSIVSQREVFQELFAVRQSKTENLDDVGGKTDETDLLERSIKQFSQERNHDKEQSVSYIDLIRVLGSHEVSHSRKIELSWQFVEAQTKHFEGEEGAFSRKEWLPQSQIVSILLDWTQSALIVSARGTYMQHNLKQNHEVPLCGCVESNMHIAYLDLRYWAVLKWCLLSRNVCKAGLMLSSLMQPITCVLSTAERAVSSSVTEGKSLNCMDVLRLDFLKVFVDAIGLLCFAHERSFRPNLDLWVSSASTTLSLALIICKETNDRRLENEIIFLFQLVTILCKGFSSFVRSNPNPRKVFQAVVGRLLESLLCIIGDLGVGDTAYMERKISHADEKKRLIKVLKNILMYTLFHPAHLGGYFDVCRSSQRFEKFVSKPVNIKRGKKPGSFDASKAKGGDIPLLSYHKLLFQQIDEFRLGGKVSVLSALAWIFSCFSERMKAQEVASTSDVFNVNDKLTTHHLASSQENITMEDDCCGLESSKDCSSRKRDDRSPQAMGKGDCNVSFMFFAELIVPLIEDLEEDLNCLYLEDSQIFMMKLFHAKSLLKAANRLLSVAREECLYVPTEDTTAQTHLRFLRNICNLLFALGTSTPQLWSMLPTEFETNDEMESMETKWSSENRMEVMSLLAVVVKEVLYGISHILELEYRVVEHNLVEFWPILLSAVSLSSLLVTDPKYEGQVVDMAREAALLGSRVVEIFSELRQVDRPIFFLCDSIRLLIQSEGRSILDETAATEVDKRKSLSEAAHLPATSYGMAIEMVLCSQEFLKAIALAMHHLPEGQVAHFISLLFRDQVDTLELFKKIDSFVSSKHGIMIQSAGNALMELYTCMLDNSNVTAVNSVQVGTSVRDLISLGLSGYLCMLIDRPLTDEDSLLNLFGLKFLRAMPRNGSRNSLRKNLMFGEPKKSEDENLASLVLLLVITFILRLYISSRGLHRQCITLMNPKAAAKASSALYDPVMAFIIDGMPIQPVLFEGGFFSCVQKESDSVYDILNYINNSIRETECERASPLFYTLQCIAIQSLSDIKVQIKAAKYLFEEAEATKLSSSLDSKGSEKVNQGEIFDIIEDEVDDCQFSGGKREADQKKLYKVLKKLRQHASALVRFLFEGIYHLYERHSGGGEGGSQVSGENEEGNWDKVVSSLSESTLPVARWHLLCRNVDVWSEYASEKHLKKFVLLILSSTFLHKQDSLEKIRAFSMSYFTKELLSDSLFYEQQSICEVFAATVCKVLEEALGSLVEGSSLLQKWINLTSTSLTDWGNFMDMIEHKVGGIGGSTNMASASELMKSRESQLLKIDEKMNFQGEIGLILGVSEKGRKRCGDFQARFPVLDRCINLVEFVSLLPKGYIKASGAATCIFTVIKLERFIVSSLVNMRDFCSSNEFSKVNIRSQALQFLEFFMACRRAMEALILSAGGAELEQRESSLTLMLVENTTMLYWLLLSIHTSAVCLFDLFESTADDSMLSMGEIILGFIVRCTTGFFTFASEDPVSSMSRCLLISEGDTRRGKGLGQNMSQGVQDRKVLDSMVRTLSAQFLKILNHVKESKFEYSTVPCIFQSNLKKFEGTHRKYTNTSNKHIYGVITSVTAVSSFLWSITTALESLDDICHSDKTGCTKWLGELPDFLLFFINDMELHFIQALQELLPSNGLVGTITNSGREFCVTKDLHEGILGVNVKNIPQTMGTIKALGVKADDFGTNEESCQLDISDEEQAHGTLDGEEDIGIKKDKEEDVEENGGSGNLSSSILYELDNEDEDRENCDGPSGKGRQINLKQQSSGNCLVEEDKCMSAVGFSDFSEMSCLQRFILRSMVEGKLRKESQILGELFMSIAAIVKLKSLFCSPNVVKQGSGPFHRLWTLPMSLHIGVAYRLMFESVLFIERNDYDAARWMSGIVKYMECVGSILPYIRPALSPIAFQKLVNVHIIMLGALIPSSQLQAKLGNSEVSNSCLNYLNATSSLGSQLMTVANVPFEELRLAVRSSLMTLLRKPLSLHFRVALQTIERSLLGFNERAVTDCRVSVNSSCGGVKRTVAAAVECVKLCLDSVAGPKRLRLLTKYTQNFMAAIFNFIAYYQGTPVVKEFSRNYSQRPNSFGKCTEDSTVETVPVILNCIDVLATVASREAIFPMKANLVAQSMQCPAILFKPFYQQNMTQLRLTQHFLVASGESKSSECQAVTSDHGSFSEKLLELYVSCCKLLRSLLRHRKRESGHCVALLGDSVRALLFFLELTNAPLANQNFGFLSIEVAVHCANWLRRVYEEIAEHKETFGKYCGHILSDYICVISGHGFMMAGLDREIDGVLRVGVYALVDACSADDLQQLHAVLGEGPRRSALLNLRQDHERHFKYTGKV